jgi:sugar phosphate permease
MDIAQAPRHPPGFRARRGLNWFIIGLLYASFYMCRYNFRWATPGMVEEFGFNKFQITSMLSAWSLAYGGVIEHAGESAGAEATTSLRESFVTIFTHPLIWFYAVAYACTGAVRNSSDQLAILYFVEQLKLNMDAKPPAVFWTMNAMPLVAVLAAFSAGVISDKIFKGRRSPVAMVLYFLETLVILVARPA